MTVLDIRTCEATEIEKIRIADSSSYTYIAEVMTPEHMGVRLRDTDNPDRYVDVLSKEHGENLIKALNKAMELGWLK